LDDVADLQHSLAITDFVLDRRIVHRHRLADQGRKIGKRSAQLSVVCVQDHLALLPSSAIVDEHHLPPTAWCEHVARDVHNADEGSSAYVDIADRAAVKVVRVERITGSLVGILANPTGAEHAARACLQQGSVKFISVCQHFGTSSSRRRK
jgi:hypothetical protein